MPVSSQDVTNDLLDLVDEDGFKELVWKLSQQHGIDARLAWSRSMHGSHFNGRQPEDLTDDEWQQVRAPFLLKRP